MNEERSRLREEICVLKCSLLIFSCRQFTLFFRALHDHTHTSKAWRMEVPLTLQITVSYQKTKERVRKKQQQTTATTAQPSTYIVRKRQLSRSFSEFVYTTRIKISCIAHVNSWQQQLFVVVVVDN
jgi:hypothetical protein